MNMNFFNQNFIFYIFTFLIFNLILGVLGFMLSKLYFSIKKLEKNVLNEYKLKNNNENKIF